MSTFLTDMGHLFTSALEVEEISGIILNPWNRTLMLNKKLINIILGKLLKENEMALLIDKRRTIPLY